MDFKPSSLDPATRVSRDSVLTDSGRSPLPRHALVPRSFRSWVSRATQILLPEGSPFLERDASESHSPHLEGASIAPFITIGAGSGQHLLDTRTLQTVDPVRLRLQGHGRDEQCSERESSSKPAHVSQPRTEVINPARGLLARSKRGTRSMPAWLFAGTRQRRRRSCASGWEETKEGVAGWWRSPDDQKWL